MKVVFTFPKGTTLLQKTLLPTHTLLDCLLNEWTQTSSKLAMDKPFTLFILQSWTLSIYWKINFSLLNPAKRSPSQGLRSW